MVDNFAAASSSTKNTIKVHAKENLLLAAMPAQIFQRLVPHMSIAEFRLGEVLYDCEDHLKDVYFPLRNTIISLIVCSAEGPSVEVGMVGREGLVEVTSFMGSIDAPYSIIVQGPGRAVKIDLKVMLSYFRKKLRKIAWSRAGPANERNNGRIKISISGSFGLVFEDLIERNSINLSFSNEQAFSPCSNGFVPAK